MYVISQCGLVCTNFNQAKNVKVYSSVDEIGISIDGISFGVYDSIKRCKEVLKELIEFSCTNEIIDKTIFSIQNREFFNKDVFRSTVMDYYNCNVFEMPKE